MLIKRLNTIRSFSSSTRKMIVPITATTPPWSVWRLNPPTSTPLNSTTLINQPQLPNLPVPSLDVTLDKLLKSCKPLADNLEELKEFERKVGEFRKKGGMGEILQKRLEIKREESGTKNWIAEWWDQDAYMTYRDSVVVNVSYYYGFERLPQSPPSNPSRSTSDPAYVAASIVSTALEFRNLISKGTLEPEQVGKKGEGELCMESYKWAFNACRVPATPADYAVKIEEEDPKGQFMVVIRKNHFYEVALKDGSGKNFGVEDFRRAFQSIYEKTNSIAPAVGILTGVNRDLWADAHTHLISTSSTNAATLASIRDSAFVISLDEASPDPTLISLKSDPTQRTSDGIKEFSERLWKAGGVQQGAGEGGNRWWDKPLQWVIFGNGEAGFIGEHSCMDGTPTARMNDFISKRLITNQPAPIGIDDSLSSTSTPPCSSLAWELDSKSLATIEKATKEFGDHTSQYQVHYLNYGRYGKDGIKKMKTSPDGWTQMVFQLAYFMTHNKPCGTYEAAQVRKFQLGRTETVRICTEETLDWTKSMMNPKISDGDKIKLFRKAVSGHGSDMKNASNGMGIDRHLFGLRKLVKEGENADLLSDPLVKRSSTWNMSTSQIYIRHSPAYGWGPVVGDGYGLPYMIHPECLQFTVTCHERMPGSKFIDNIGKAADILMDLMEKESSPAKL